MDPMRIWGPHKILESGFGNPNPNAFALLLVQLVDPDQVRIRNYLHFVVLRIFDGSGSEDLDPGSRPIQAALENFYHGILIKNLTDSRLLSCESGLFRIF
jgi:hypothetical protein